MLKIILSATLLTATLSSQAMGVDLRVPLVAAAIAEQVPLRLLEAVVYVESRNGPKAFKAGDGGKHNPAIGLGQILYKTAKGLGWKEDKRCLIGDSRCTLFVPQVNLYYSALFLRHKLDLYHGNWDKAVAAYNAGSARYTQHGHLKNSNYVDKVMKALARRDRY